MLEVVSPDKPEHDLVKKRRDYAELGISEYWIVDPQAETITMLRLEGGAYGEHSVFGRGTVAESSLLPGLTVSADVDIRGVGTEGWPPFARRLWQRNSI